MTATIIFLHTEVAGRGLKSGRTERLTGRREPRGAREGIDGLPDGGKSLGPRDDQRDSRALSPI